MAARGQLRRIASGASITDVFGLPRTLDKASPVRRGERRGMFALDTSQTSISNNSFTSLSVRSLIWSGVTGIVDDDDNWKSEFVSPTRITVPKGQAGTYLLLGYASFNAVSPNAGSRAARFRKNGTTSYGETYAAGSATINGSGVMASTVLTLAETDYVELQCYQQNGAAGAVTMVGAFVLAVYLGPSVNACAAYTTTGNSASNATDTAVALGVEAEDRGGFHDTVTNNSRVTVPETATYLIFYAGSVLPAGGTVTVLKTFLRKNGTTTFSESNANDDVVSIGSVTEFGNFDFVIATLSANDYVEVMVNQTSGGSKTIKGQITIVKLTDTQKYALAQKNATQTPTLTTWTDLVYGAELFDTDGMHDTSSNTDRLTVQTKGTYLLLARQVTAAGATGNKAVGLRFSKNNAGAGNAAGFGLVNLTTNDSVNTNKRAMLMCHYRADVGDYFDTQAYHDPAVVVQATQTVFGAIRIEDWNI